MLTHQPTTCGSINFQFHDARSQRPALCAVGKLRGTEGANCGSLRSVEIMTAWPNQSWQPTPVSVCRCSQGFGPERLHSSFGGIMRARATYISFTNDLRPRDISSVAPLSKSE